MTTTVLHVLTVADSLIFLKGQAAFMRTQGIELVVACADGPRFDEMIERTGCPGFRVPMARAITPRKDVVALRALTRVIHQVQPDIVHGHTPKGGLIGMLAATACGISRRVFHLRGLAAETSVGWRRSLLLNADRVTCGLANRVVCVSPSLLDTAVKHHVLPRRKGRVLSKGSGNGVDSLHFGVPGAEERKTARRELGLGEGVAFLFLGRLVGDKGIRELTTAWEHMRRSHPTARLILAGPWEERDGVDARTRRALEDDPSVLVTGFVSDPRGLYHAADALVLPSHREGFPNVPLEAASSGLPVITTMATGCRDAVIDGVTGFLVPVDDAVALRQAMARLANDAGLRREMGARGRARVVESFRPEQIWRELAGLYTGL